MRIILAQPRGYCAGVIRAIRTVELALEKFGPPIYVRHEIVHNQRVLATLRKKGAVFVKELDEVPDGAITLFSAHGVAERVARTADERNLPVIDATCPLVEKVHREAIRYAEAGREVLVIGHAGHPEIVGTLGRTPGPVQLVSSVENARTVEVQDPDRLAYVTQTTLSVDDTRDVIGELRRRFPAIRGPDIKDICYATQNRQTAVRRLARQTDLILVLGSRNSSNSNRLREIGASEGVPSYLIDDAEGVDPGWLHGGVEAVGITSGASAPEELVQEVVARLRSLGAATVETLDGVRESVSFRLPREVQAASTRSPTLPNPAARS